MESAVNAVRAVRAAIRAAFTSAVRSNAIALLAARTCRRIYQKCYGLSETVTSLILAYAAMSPYYVTMSTNTPSMQLNATVPVHVTVSHYSRVRVTVSENTYIFLHFLSERPTKTNIFRTWLFVTCSGAVLSRRPNVQRIQVKLFRPLDSVTSCTALRG